MPDNIGKFCFRCLGQILRCQTDLRSDLAAADIDLLLCLCAFIDSGHVLLFACQWQYSRRGYNR